MATKIRYTHAELEELWLLAGGSAASADMAAAIAQAESGGCIYAKAGPTDDRPQKTCTYRATNGENSYGLWQVNRRAHPQYTAASLYTATGNARAASEIANGGAAFSAWSTYKNGAYKQYLQSPVTLTTGQTTQKPTPVGAVAPNALAGFTHFSRSLGVTLPTRLRQARKIRRATLRALR